ncbi:hypothetical protein [Kitasatospora sp. NPDC057223]|uniref:hypothetical protein n=1 Tax=Kitasatospora sp. NPDC057223 TaxID=3346055 RepID=UPI00362D5631
MTTEPLRRMPLRPFDRAAVGRLLATTAEEPLFHPTTALYRFFDGQLRLLYVGVTGQLCERWPKHRRKAEWWSAAEFVAVEHWRAMHLALDAERHAIRTELPLFNRRSRTAGA